MYFFFFSLHFHCQCRTFIRIHFSIANVNGCLFCVVLEHFVRMAPQRWICQRPSFSMIYMAGSSARQWCSNSLHLSWTLVLSSSDKISMIIMMSTTMLDDSTTQLHTVADGWRCCHYHKRIMHSVCVCLSMMKLHIAFRPSAQSTLHSPIRLNILKRWGWDDYMSQRHRTRPWRDSTRMPLAMAVNKYHHHHHLRGDQTPFVSIELHSIFIGMALLAGGNVESRFTAVAKIDSRPSECHYDGTRAQNWNFEIATQKADATF